MTDTAKGKKVKPKSSWRDVLPVHPAADLFPLMPPDELKALGEDIKKNGLTSPIVLWKPDDNTVAQCLLDGRNRLDAMELVGLAPKLDLKSESVTVAGNLSGWQQADYVAGVDPYEYVLSANLHRRHLTAEQKRKVIAKLIKAKPEASNLAIAKQVKVATDKTVASVRRELEANSEIPNKTDRSEATGRKARGRKPQQKPPPTTKPKSATAVDRDDIGDDSRGEADRLRARIETLHAEIARKDQRIKELCEPAQDTRTPEP